MSAEFVLPTYINGQQTWMAEADPELVRKLKYGDPTIGWDGDERLYLRHNQATGGWTVWRLGENGVEYAICSSTGAHKLDERLLIRLRDHDSRKVDVWDKANKQNEAAAKTRDTEMYEKQMEQMEKVYWAVGKDVGHQY